MEENKNNEIIEETLDSVDEAQDSGELVLSTLSSSENEAPVTKKAGMVKKQKILIISFACLFVVLAILYFAVIRPLYIERTTEEPYTPPELLEGEDFDIVGRNILIFKHIEKKNVKSIEVHNSYGQYTVIRVDDQNFYIKEHPQAPLSAETLTSIVVDAGYPVVSRRVEIDCKDYSKYGLSEEDNPAYYIITTTSDEVQKVYIGNRIASGGGFYARVEGRNAVYMLGAGISETLLTNAASLFTPLLGNMVPQNEFAKVEEVIMMKNGEPFVYIVYDHEDVSDLSLSAYTMVYPANYLVNDDNYSAVLLQSFISLQGYKVLAVGSPDHYLRDDEALMAQFGFYDMKHMPYELYYTYNDIATSIAFAPSGVDGYYFAYSYLYDLIAIVEQSTVPYLEWDLLQYVNSALFAEYIWEVKEISVEGTLKKNGVNYNISETFTYELVQQASGNKLTCKVLPNEYHGLKTYTGTRTKDNPVQGFYGSALSMKMLGYIKVENVDVSTLSEFAKMTVTRNNGEKTEYVFYKYSERCYYTIDGKGEFYLSAKGVNKLLIDAVRAAYGEIVDSNEEYPELPSLFIEAFDA